MIYDLSIIIACMTSWLIVGATIIAFLLLIIFILSDND